MYSLVKRTLFETLVQDASSSTAKSHIGSDSAVNTHNMPDRQACTPDKYAICGAYAAPRRFAQYYYSNDALLTALFPRILCRTVALHAKKDE
ncbi:hypothetical protein [Mesorhizobium xinjiangense]|uniref:hypothetical protein n=1 Tax=Mesorhizobium xinjiangense TaxID=2678685 RepID=UPI0012ED69C8|nr:hypothetical protein [Mesorhizobium xinjiangense]